MCPLAMLARAALFLCLIVGSRQLSITELVVPSTVRAGESAELVCRVDAAPEDQPIVKWWRIPFDSSVDKLQIYQRMAPSPGAPMHHTHLQVKDDDSIVLLEVLPGDSSTYECEAYTLLGEVVEETKRRQDLLVYTPGLGPQLNISAVQGGLEDEEDVLIECRADDVAPEPALLLKINGEEYVNVTEEVIGPDDAGYYDALVAATLPRAAVEGATVTCELVYNDTRISHEPYVASEDYHSGATTTEAPEESTIDVIPSDSLQKQSGDSTAIRASWNLLLALSLLKLLQSLF